MDLLEVRFRRNLSKNKVSGFLDIFFFCVGNGDIAVQSGVLLCCGAILFKFQEFFGKEFFIMD